MTYESPATAPPPPPPHRGLPRPRSSRRRRWLGRLLSLLIVVGILWLGWTALQWLILGPPATVPDGSWLHVRFDEEYPEARPERGGLRRALAPRPLSAQELLFALHRVREDPRVKGVLLEPDGFPGGWAQAHELHALLRTIRDDGKKVWSYVENPSSIDYYLGSAAETVYVAPEGQVDILGLSLRMSYLKNSLDKLGVEADFVAVGEYKSAPEQLTQEQPSEASRAQSAAWLDDVYAEWMGGLSSARGLTLDRLSLLVDQAPLDAEQALKSGLVDVLRARPLLWEDAAWPELITADRYLRAVDGWGDEHSGPGLALIFVEGTIVAGAGGRDGILGPWAGSDTVNERLEQAREDDRVAAVVLRIDSPGGSAIASDLIYRQIQRVQERKPVLVSMANFAASGGYYIGMSADHVLADPLTVTGSIGVYSGKLIAREFYEKLGLSFETLRRGENADLYSELGPFGPDQRKRLIERLVGFYARFVERVADGRRLAREDVERAARGRIWSGQSAVEHGLVDELGGLGLALRRAQEHAGLPVDRFVRVQLYQEKAGWLERSLRNLFSAQVSTLPSGVSARTWGPLLPGLARRSVAALHTLDGSPQFHLPWILEIQ